MGRQARNTRRRGGVVKLTPRDESLLRALARFRVARSGDLGRLFFPGRHRDVLVSRLRKLYDAQFVEVHMLERAAENVYTLGPRGKAWLLEQGTPAASPPRPPWHHHLGIVKFWSKLAASIHSLQGLHLMTFLPEWEIREREQNVDSRVVPDALVEMGLTRDRPANRWRLVLEVDRGTEGLAVLRRKLQAYSSGLGSSLAERGWSDFSLVLFLLDDGRTRERSIRDLLAAEWSGAGLVWTDQRPLEEELKGLCRSSTATVTPSRSSNGTPSPTSTDAHRPSAVTGGGLSGDE